MVNENKVNIIKYNVRVSCELQILKTNAGKIVYKLTHYKMLDIKISLSSANSELKQINCP